MNRDRAFRDSAHCWLAALGCAALSCALATSSGCGFSQQNALSVEGDAQASYYQVASTQIEYPSTELINDDVLSTAPPIDINDLSDDQPIEFKYITLQDAIHEALKNSRVLRDLGGVVLRNPDDVSTTYDVALQELDPRFGVASALSEFDASFAASAFVDKNDRSLNNQFFGGGTRLLKQDTATVESQVTKLAATGTQLKLLNHTEYDSNNAPGNAFNSAWTTWLDMEIRHPLMQGGGADFLRIAGPADSPGSINGVVVARLRTDVSLADFEMSVRDFVSNVENAYWDLYFAYRDLDARLVARDTALVTWNRINALKETGRVGGEAQKEAQAREQYFRFQEQVQNALSGRLDDSTRTNNGSAGGSFRGNGGVMTSERRLRLLMALPVNDGVLLRTKDEPIMSRVVFDWDSVLVEALTRRAELRRQKWIVKQRELELQAMHNFLKPNLDVVGRYRWRGFGHDLFDQDSDERRFNNAVENFTEGDFQEWQIGAELSFPFGNRRAHTAVEYAEVRLTRERVVLAEQEREVVHTLSNSIAEMNRSWSVLQTAGDRLAASKKQREVVQVAFDADKVNVDVLLESQRRFQDAETNYYRVLLEYTLAIRNVHFEKGSLLDYNEVYLTEDLWPMQAYSEAMARRNNTHEIPEEWRFGLINHPRPVNAGSYLQELDPVDTETWDTATDAAPAIEPAAPVAPEIDVEVPAPTEPSPVEPAAAAEPIPMPPPQAQPQPLPDTPSARASVPQAPFVPATAAHAAVLLPESFAEKVTAGFFARPPTATVIEQTSLETTSPSGPLPLPLPEANEPVLNRPMAPRLGNAE
jgi:outer membrane protein TolC